MSPSLPSHDTRRRDALSIDALVERPSTRQCGKCQEAQTRCDGREPCRNCEVRGTLCGYAWSSFSAPHTLPSIHPGAQPTAQFAPPAKRRSPVPTGSIFPRSNALDGGWAIVPQGTNAPTAHPAGPVLSCKTCQARNTPCDGVTPVCGSCRIRRLECYLATPSTSNANMRNGNSATMSWSARDRQALNPRSFPPSLSQAAMLLPPARPRAPSDASKPSRSSLSFMLNPKPEGKVASGSKGNAQRPTELKPVNTLTPTHHVTTPTHHVTPPTPVAPASMEQAQATGPMDVDPPTSPGSSTEATSLSRRPSRKRSASPESHYGREDSPGRESVSSLGMSTLAMGERRTRALSHIHSPRSSIESHGRPSFDSQGRLEPHSPRNSIDLHPRNSMDLARNAVDHRTHSARASMDSHHSPTRSARNSLDSPFSARGQPLEGAHSARALNPVDSHSNSHRSVDPPRPIDSNPDSHSNHSMDPHHNRAADSHSNHSADPGSGPHVIDAHRRSIDQQGLASPIDPNRPRSRSKTSLSHLLDGGGFGGMSSPTHTASSTHTAASPVSQLSQNKSSSPGTSPIHTQAPIHTNTSPVHTTQKSPIHPSLAHTTAYRPPRTPSSEHISGPNPTGFGPSPSPKSYGPGPSPTAARSPTSMHGPRSPAATTASEPFSRPVSAESYTRPVSAESFPRPVGREPGVRDGNPGTHRGGGMGIPHRDPGVAHREPGKEPNPTHRDPIPHPAVAAHHAHPPKQTSISTALADMQLKSAGTSRASSPGGHARDVFVHSAFNGGNARHYPNWTFGAAGENLAERKPGGEGRMANVWRHETEAGMRRREAEAELRKQDQVELHRRRSEGAKRRKLGESEDENVERRMSVVSEERRMSIVEPEKRESSGRRMSTTESERRMSIVEPEKRMSIVEPDKRSFEAEKGVEPEKRASERKGSVSQSDRRMSIVEELRRATEAHNTATKDGNRANNSLPITRGTTDVFRARRGSAPMPGAWTDEKQSVIVISDSPELVTGDTEMDIPEQTEKLFPGGAQDSAERSGDQLTPLGPFGHIWPPPVIESGKKGRRPKDPEPAPTRSFITPLNLPPVPPTTQVKQSTPIVDDEAKDKEAGSSQPSALRSMLTTMPPRAAFVAEVQNFLSQPATKTRRNRAVIMTKALMKDALGVLLDPQTDELLKDYVPPEKKEDEKSDGTKRKMSVAIDTTDHTSLEFRAWAKRMFTTVKTSRGEDALAFDGKPVVVEDDIYETIVVCHSQGNHCGIDETAKLVDQEHSWVPRALIEAFVQKCPRCPWENKITNTTTKPKKRKSVRGGAPTGGPRRKPTARRGKKQDGESVRRSRKYSGKEASPEESDADEGDQEEDELKESGDEAGPADVKTDDPEPEPAGEDQDQDQDQDQDEAEPEPEPDPEPEAEADADEPDEAEEPEMESEDEHVSRPTVAGRKNGL